MGGEQNRGQCRFRGLLRHGVVIEVVLDATVGDEPHDGHGDEDDDSAPSPHLGEGDRDHVDDEGELALEVAPEDLLSLLSGRWEATMTVCRVR
jgi:hypothetical protein